MGKDLGGFYNGYGEEIDTRAKEISDLKLRIRQLEDSFKQQQLLVPPIPYPTLAEDEWYAIFSNYQNTVTGMITKIPWQGGSNATAVYKVKRIG